jgi:acylphosphatase
MHRVLSRRTRMESGDRERAHVYVSGGVQGVFFRDSARERAEQLGLAGWVRNLPDGRVEAVFEGPREKVREMVRWCEEGPPHATVKDVDAEFEAPAGDLRGFEVR